MACGRQLNAKCAVVKVPFFVFFLVKTTMFNNDTAKCLRITASTIAGSWNYLFNLSLAREEIPQEWKAAKVTPIFKAGNEMKIENYRPISVLPVVVKVFERLVYGQLYSFLLERNL